MASLGFPNSWQSAKTTGYRTAGAVQKGSGTRLGFPRSWQSANTVGYLSAGAVQKYIDISGTLTATLDNCTLSATGTFTAPVGPGGGGANGGGLMEDVAQQRYIQPSTRGIATAVSRTLAAAAGNPRIQIFALANGKTTGSAAGYLRASTQSAARGYSAIIGAGSMHMSSRTIPYIRRISAPFAIG